jgi:hypothetical protein
MGLMDGGFFDLPSLFDLLRHHKNDKIQDDLVDFYCLELRVFTVNF